MGAVHTYELTLCSWPNAVVQDVDRNYVGNSRSPVRLGNSISGLGTDLSIFTANRGGKNELICGMRFLVDHAKDFTYSNARFPRQVKSYLSSDPCHAEMLAARTQPSSFFPVAVSLLSGSCPLNPSQTVELKSRGTAAAGDKSPLVGSFLGLRPRRQPVN